jgi:aminopeptidase
MFDDFAPRLAQILTAYSVPIQKGDLVGISASTNAEPIVHALYEAVLKRGGHPYVMASLPGLQETFFRNADDDQLDYCNPILLYAIEHLDVFFQIIAPTNTKALAKVDPALVARNQKGPPVGAISGVSGMVAALNITAANAKAREAEMGLLDYTGHVQRLRAGSTTR